MPHAYVQRFDVTENFEKFCKILGTNHALTRKILGPVWLTAWPGVLAQAA